MSQKNELNDGFKLLMSLR